MIECEVKQRFTADNRIAFAIFIRPAVRRYRDIEQRGARGRACVGLDAVPFLGIGQCQQLVTDGFKAFLVGFQEFAKSLGLGLEPIIEFVVLSDELFGGCFASNRAQV